MAADDGKARGAGQGKRDLDVLLVENDPLVRQVIESQLETLGHRSTSTENGKEALRAAACLHFDWIIVDFSLPDMSGKELIRALRSDSPRAGLIVASGYGARLRDEFREFPEVRFLDKPFALDGLRAALAPPPSSS